MGRALADAAVGDVRPVQTARNDYLIDRESQAKMESFSSIPDGANPQETGIQESMGPIYDRTSEHLGTTDVMVIKTRRKLIQAAKTFEEIGATLPGVEKPEPYRQRSRGVLAPRCISAIRAREDLIFGRSVEVDAPLPLIPIGTERGVHHSPKGS